MIRPDELRVLMQDCVLKKNRNVIYYQLVSDLFVLKESIVTIQRFNFQSLIQGGGKTKKSIATF